MIGRIKKAWKKFIKWLADGVKKIPPKCGGGCC
jgi:hypothetical protein